jgi:hypothetical protein
MNLFIAIVIVRDEKGVPVPNYFYNPRLDRLKEEVEEFLDSPTIHLVRGIKSNPLFLTVTEKNEAPFIKSMEYKTNLAIYEEFEFEEGSE